MSALNRQAAELHETFIHSFRDSVPCVKLTAVTKIRKNTEQILISILPT